MMKKIKEKERKKIVRKDKQLVLCLVLMTGLVLLF